MQNYPVWFIPFAITVLFIGWMVGFPRGAPQYAQKIWPTVVSGLGLIAIAVMWIFFLT